MRKRLLRSRSGFEKPESREEAIMQNILGASNVLEPSESNIEEILKSILYNTPYAKEAEFEIEKILLAIKNNGTYDGEHESRDLKILFAILNDLDYTEEAESRIEELFIEWLHQRSSIKVLEGIPPLTFTSLGQPLINYLIEGNTVQSGTPTPENPIMPQGTGERTGNLFDEDYPNISGTVRYSPLYVGEGSFTLSTTTPYDSSVANLFLLSGNVSKGASTEGNGAWKKHNVTAQSVDGYVTIAYRHYSGTTSPVDCQTMLSTGSQPLPYEPWGVKIPISSANTTTPIYLGEVETTRKIGKIDLGTLNWSITASGNFWADAPIPNCRIVENVVIGNAICSHFTETSANSVANTPYSFSSCLNSQARPFVNKTGFESMTAAEFKQAMSGVYMYYVLATEQTGIVNEPLMKIGEYADSISKEQASVEIPTVNGSNTLDVDTTVKPSNIYIEYK